MLQGDIGTNDKQWKMNQNNEVGRATVGKMRCCTRESGSGEALNGK